MTAKARIGVVGAGTMGRGIAQLFAQSGHPVSVYDGVAATVTDAIAAIGSMIDKGVAKNQFTPEHALAVKAAIKPCSTLDALADCGVVIEAIIEEIGAKQALFGQLESILGEQAILASNTSSLIIAEIAAKCRHPGRVAGLHFFNPVPLMKVVEVIASVRTHPATIETLRALVSGTGHRAVEAADQPGFLINHAGRGYYTEALRVLEEQVATHAEVDVLLREAAGFRMGPFELLDLTGLDVSGKVMESIYELFHQEPRFRPSSLVPPRIAAGLYGRKSREGWYSYGKETKPTSVVPPDAAPLTGSETASIWIDPRADQRAELASTATAVGARLVDQPSEAALIVIQPWGWDASSYCAEHCLDARRCIAIDPLPGLERRITLMLTAVTEPVARRLATSFLAQAGKPFTVIGDSPGFIVQRVLATIVNIASNIAQRRIATVADIDDAVRLGLGYPFGPLSWGDRIGADKILAILRAMQTLTGDPRYRPSPWLMRRASLGVSLLTEEAGRS
jgi:3-hydroxybutyryl-CoA dehydrogenase